MAALRQQTAVLTRMNSQTLTAYIRFCKECVVEPKMIKMFSNNKPQISKDLNVCLVAEKHAFIHRKMGKVLNLNKNF